MTKMAAMPLYNGKNLQKSCFQNQKADDLETWYAALVTWVLSKLFKWLPFGWPWPILQQGQIWSLLFLYGKMLKL